MTNDDRMPEATQATGPHLLTIVDHQPPRAVTDDWNWQILGACRGMDVDLFYHPARERRHTKQRRIDQAKTICQTCPVITECATWALKTREPYGVWGGLSEAERAAQLGLNDLRYPGSCTPRSPTANKPVERDAPETTLAHSSA